VEGIEVILARFQRAFFGGGAIQGCAKHAHPWLIYSHASGVQREIISHRRQLADKAIDSQRLRRAKEIRALRKGEEITR